MERSVAENPASDQEMSAHWNALDLISTVTESRDMGQNGVLLQPSFLKVLEIA